jgi:hypothetical protein
VWRRGQWRIFDQDIFASFLSDSLNPIAANDLILTLYSLAKIRHGTVVLINDGSELGQLKKGSVAGEDGSISRNLINQFIGRTVTELKNSGDLIRLLSSDGLTIINQGGELVDTGFIIDISGTEQQVTGGGRTTAATAASFHGKVIKVLEDDLISLYENGECIYKFG